MTKPPKHYTQCAHEDCDKYNDVRSVPSFIYCEEPMLAHPDVLKILMQGIVAVADEMKERTRLPESDY